MIRFGSCGRRRVTGREMFPLTEGETGSTGSSASIQMIVGCVDDVVDYTKGSKVSRLVLRKRAAGRMVMENGKWPVGNGRWACGVSPGSCCLSTDGLGVRIKTRSDRREVKMGERRKRDGVGGRAG